MKDLPKNHSNHKFHKIIKYNPRYEGPTKKAISIDSFTEYAIPCLDIKDLSKNKMYYLFQKLKYYKSGYEEPTQK